MNLLIPDELVEARARQGYTTRHPHWDELTPTQKAPMLDRARRELEAEVETKHPDFDPGKVATDAN